MNVLSKPIVPDKYNFSNFCVQKTKIKKPLLQNRLNLKM